MSSIGAKRTLGWVGRIDRFGEKRTLDRHGANDLS